MPTFQTPQGFTMHFTCQGPEQSNTASVPTLCVHGNPTYSYFYRHVSAALSKQATVVAPCHIGCGHSEKPQKWPYRLAGHIENLQALVAYLDANQPGNWRAGGNFNLIVHDWGGAIGSGLAASMPGRIHKVVILNTAAWPSKRVPLRILVCKVPLLGALLVRGLNGFARVAAWGAANAKGKAMPKSRQKEYLKPYNNWKNRIATHRFVQDIPIIKSHPSYTTLKNIGESLETTYAGKPMLIAWGMQDFCFNTHFLKGWKRRFPQAEVVEYTDAGHYVLEDATQDITARIEAFLNG